MSTPAALLVLPHLKVQNANAIAAPQVWGFPGMTAFQGFAEALERKLPESCELSLEGIGVICHHHDALISSDLSIRFRQQRSSGGNREQRADQGTRGGGLSLPPVIEEGRMNLDVTLVIEVVDGAALNDPTHPEVMAALERVIGSMRLAGGRIEPISVGPELHMMGGEPERSLSLFRSLMRRSLPGYALVHRPDIVEDITSASTDTNDVDAWLDLFSVHSTPGSLEPEDQNLDWVSRRAQAGWLVPIPIGYAELAPKQAAGTVPGVRSQEHEVAFVESLYSVGEWVGAHRIREPGQLFWYRDDSSPSGTYCLANDFDMIAGVGRHHQERS